MDMWVVSTFRQYICVRVFVWMPVSILLSIFLDLALLSHMIILFNFLRKLQTVLHYGPTISLSQQQRTKTPVSLYSHQHLLLPVCLNYFIIAILLGMKWHIIVIPQHFNYYNFVINLISDLASFFLFFNGNNKLFFVFPNRLGVNVPVSK